MAEDLRSLIHRHAAGFREVRKNGYDREAVDDLIADLLSHIDAAEEAESRPVASLARRHFDQMGEKMAELLNTAEQKAAELQADAEREATELVDEARREATELVDEARREATELTTSAEAYARAEREAADRYASEARRVIRSELEKARDEGERQVRERIEAAEERARAIIERAEAERRDLDAAMALLEQRREKVSEGLRKVARYLDTTVEQVNALGSDESGEVEPAPPPPPRRDAAPT